MLSDEQLLTRLKTLCRVSRRVDARIIQLLIEVEDRRLELRMANASLWDFCRRTLGMSEGTTQRRIEAVRAVQRIPRLLGLIASGAVTLGSLALVRTHLTEENVDALIAEIAGKTRKQIEELLVARAPRPDVPARLRLLPTPGAAMPAAADAASPPPMVSAPLPSPTSAHAGAIGAPAIRPRLEPLSPRRWKLQITADQSLHDQLERAQVLMRHRNPSGDLAVIVAAAVDLLVEKLENERLAARKRPLSRARNAKEPAAEAAAAPPSTSRLAAPPPPARPGAKGDAVTRAVRRAVFARDGERCTYVDGRGERCPAKTWLELDHIDARGRGGAGTVENIRVRCRAHNHHHAEVVFGKSYVARRIRERRAGRSAPARSRDEPP